jgi:hypothetical protein
MILETRMQKKKSKNMSDLKRKLNSRLSFEVQLEEVQRRHHSVIPVYPGGKRFQYERSKTVTGEHITIQQFLWLLIVVALGTCTYLG